MSIVAVVVVGVQESDAQHHVISGCRLGQIQREQREIVLVMGGFAGRVDRGGCPPRPRSDPGLHITRTRFLIS